MVFREVLEMAFSRERSGDSCSDIGYGLWEVLEKVRITRLRGICHPRYFLGLYFVPWLYPLAKLGRPTRGGQLGEDHISNASHSPPTRALSYRSFSIPIFILSMHLFI